MAPGEDLNLPDGGEKDKSKKEEEEEVPPPSSSDTSSPPSTVSTDAKIEEITKIDLKKFLSPEDLVNEKINDNNEDDAENKVEINVEHAGPSTDNLQGVEKVTDTYQIELKEEKGEIEENKGTIEDDGFTVTEPTCTAITADNVGSIQDAKDMMTEAANSIVQNTVAQIDDEIEKKVEKEEKEDIILKDDKMKISLIEPAFADENILPVRSIQDIKDAEIKLKEEENKGTIKEDSFTVTEPTCTEEIVDNVGSIQDAKDILTEAANSIIQNIVAKIDDEIEKNVEKEERDNISLTDEINISLIEPVFAHEIVLPVGSIEDTKDDEKDAGLSSIEEILDKNIQNKAEATSCSTSENVAIIEIIDKLSSEMQYSINDKYKDKEEGIIPATSEDTVLAEECFTAKEVRDIIDIESEMNAQKEKRKDIIENVMKEEIIQLEKVCVSADSTIEKKKEDEGKGDIIEVNDKDEKAGIEPVFKEVISENVEAIQDIKEAVTVAASSLMQKIVDTIDSKIEQKVEEEEKIFQMEQINKNAKKDINKEGLKEIKEVNDKNQILAAEAAFTEESVETLKSIDGNKDGLDNSSTSVLQTDGDTIDNIIEPKFEEDERRVSMKEENKNENIEIKDVVFMTKIEDRPDNVKAVIQEMDGMLENEYEDQNQKSPILLTELEEDSSHTYEEEFIPIEPDNEFLEKDMRPTDNELKMQAPSFTKLNEETFKDEKYEPGRPDVLEVAPVEDAQVEKHGLQVQCAVAVGTIAVAVLAILIALFFYYQ